jgi:hypothetical protein
LRNKLQLLNESAQQNAVEQQKLMKQLYDKQSTARHLAIDSLVLLLQPVSTHKLFAAWSGPHRVIECLSDNNYIIDLDGRRAVRHINLLRPYYTRSEMVGVVLSADADDPHSEEQLPTTVEYTDTGDKQFNIGNQLSDEQRQKLLQTLNKFPDVFSEVPGRTNLVEHVIQLRDERPCKQPKFRIPEKLKPEVEAEIANLIKGGYIRESDSEFVSNLVVVRRKTGSIRLCTDMRLINAKTIPCAYKGPDIQDIINKAAASKFISLIDLRQFYWQIPLSKSSQKYCGFYVDGIGQYCWTVTPFGCMNASKTAQKLMDKILSGLRHLAAAFQDDLIVFSSSFEQHLEHLNQVLTRLREAGLTANIVKCEFVVQKLSLLGHIVQDQTIRPSDDKLEAVAKLDSKSLTTKKQVKSVLGLVNFFRSFIPNCAKIALPLTALLRKNQPEKISWNDECERALQTLKDALLSDRCLFAHDYAKPYHLFTDASNGAIGAWIGQYDSSGQLRPIAFASKKLTDCQLNYSVIEKELFAVVWSVQYFKQYLYDSEIHLYSDHRPLQWLHTLTQHSPRLAR